MGSQRVRYDWVSEQQHLKRKAYVSPGALCSKVHSKYTFINLETRHSQINELIDELPHLKSPTFTIKLKRMSDTIDLTKKFLFFSIKCTENSNKRFGQTNVCLYCLWLPLTLELIDQELSRSRILPRPPPLPRCSSCHPPLPTALEDRRFSRRDGQWQAWKTKLSDGGSQCI